MIPFVVALLAKLTLILAAGLIVTAAFRSASPSIRHLVLLATIVCGLTLPAAMLISPSWDVAVLPQFPVNLFSSKPEKHAAVPTQTSGSIPAIDARSPQGASVAPTAPSDPALSGSPTDFAVVTQTAGRGAFALPLFWVTGLILVVAWLAIGRIRLRHIARRAWPLGADWKTILDEARAEAGVTRDVRLLSSTVVSTPLTWGSVSPVILLPEDARDWSEEHRRVVLRHELAHVARRDSLAQLLAGFVCALYWFHPLVWMSERRLRAECERACDDRVVSLGTPPTEYASHLLEVARSARAFGAPGFLSVAMARPSQLEGRLLAVLNESRRRVAASRGARIVALLLAALVMLPLAAFRPVARHVTGETTRLARVIKPTMVEYGRELLIPADLKPKSTEKVVNTYRSDTDTTFELSAPVRSGGTLNLELKTGGDITISGWDRPQVVVRAALGGRDWRLTHVTLQPSDGDATLESSFTGFTNNQSTSHRFDIEVPRNFNVRINSAGGGISITSVDGTFTGHTGGGEVTIKKVNGEVNIRTGGGEVYVGESRLNGSVSTGGGLIRIVGVDGNFNGYSGSGPVITTDSRDSRYEGSGIGGGKSASVSIAGPETSASVSARATTTTVTTDDGERKTTRIDNGAGKGYGYGYGTGAIRMTSAGGGLSLPSAPEGARVTTGGGRIYIGPSGGEVYAQTGGGPIDIGPATGSVAAHTGAGDINVELKGSGSHDVDVTSGKGQVVLVLPSDLNATLELETAYTDNFGRKTRIVSDWPLNVTETNNWDDSQGTPRKYVRVRQKIGSGGGLIRVRTVNGNVVLKRGT
ncbi:MAG: hypothetical protein DMD63_02310 [Gemmatimonadetes bacterium]|nr:MAG: hypothetical protein DMD63_02310 [Gemmatimonadota bacterium]